MSNTDTDNSENQKSETQANPGGEGHHQGAEKVENESVNRSTPVEAAVSPEESFKQKYVYLVAETDNLRKRLEREKQQMVKFANESILQDLIEVVDNFERTTLALSFDQDDKIKNISIGIDMVKKQFLDALARHGLEPIVSVGKDFDPNIHEAVGQESMEGKRNQEVIKEYQRGYQLNGRLLRPARVVVAQISKA